MKKLLLLFIIPFLSFGQVCEDEEACNYLNDYWCVDGPCAYPGDLCDNPNYFYDENCNCVEMFLPIICEDINSCNYGDPLPFFPPANPWEWGSGYLMYDLNCIIISEEPCDYDCVTGCTDPEACNYCEDCFIDDGSCDYSCYGCTDPEACNYDNTAIIDNGLCEYYSCYGCTDPEACNYCEDCFIDDGSCDYSCYGCTDPEACNYDNNATIDNELCEYPDLCGSCNSLDLCACSELTFVPDDSFEEYLETFIPGASNGDINDNYVNTAALNPATNDEISELDINLCAVTLSSPIFDITGIENIRGPMSINITDQLISTLDLSCVKTQEELFTYNAYSGSPSVYSSIHINGCELLEEIILPSDSLRVFSVTACPLLENIVFSDDLVLGGYMGSSALLYGIAINDCDNLCNIDFKGKYIGSQDPSNPSASFSYFQIIANENLKDINFSNILELAYGSTLNIGGVPSFGTYGYSSCYETTLGVIANQGQFNLNQINLSGTTYDWGSVTMNPGYDTDNFTFMPFTDSLYVQVDNVNYCEVSEDWPDTTTPITGQSINLYYSESGYSPTCGSAETELGCTDFAACNYNYSATEDDSSCDYSCYCDTIYIDNFITDTIVETEFIELTDTIYIDNLITDTVVETEYIDVIITEYIDCDSGLPCESGMGEIIEKSKIDGKIYNLLGQEILRRDGIYIEGGEVKYRF